MDLIKKFQGPAERTTTERITTITERTNLRINIERYLLEKSRILLIRIAGIIHQWNFRVFGICNRII